MKAPILNPAHQKPQPNTPQTRIPANPSYPPERVGCKFVQDMTDYIWVKSYDSFAIRAPCTQIVDNLTRKYTVSADGPKGIDMFTSNLPLN